MSIPAYLKILSGAVKIAQSSVLNGDSSIPACLIASFISLKLKLTHSILAHYAIILEARRGI